jgi:hypothetical protein
MMHGFILCTTLFLDLADRAEHTVLIFAILNGMKRNES